MKFIVTTRPQGVVATRWKGGSLILRAGSDSFDHIVQAIYAAAIAPGQVGPMLRGLAGLFDAHFADHYARTHDGSHAAGEVHGLDADDYQDGMITTWAGRNPWTRKSRVTAAGEVSATWQFLDRADLVRSEMFGAYLDPRGLHEGMRIATWSDGHGIEDISLLRSVRAGPFTPRELDLGRTLFPHLQQAAIVRHRLRFAELTSQACLDALATLRHPVLLLDQSARPVSMNPAANTLLAEADGLHLTERRLAAATPALTARLDAALASATARDRAPTAANLLLPRSSGRPTLALVVMPLRWDGAWSRPGHPAAMLCIGNAGAAPADLTLVSSLFGLTAAETRLTADLLAGYDLALIARRQGRSLATLRTHLARVMAKTETSRQSELVMRVLSIPRPLPA